MQFQNNFVIAATFSKSNIIDYFNLCAQPCLAHKHCLKCKKNPNKNKLSPYPNGFTLQAQEN